MPILTAICFIIAFVMAVAVGAQTRSWTWGPAMLPLGIAALFAIVAIWKSERRGIHLGSAILGAMVVSWFAWRAWISPVHELGQADLLLLAGAVASYCCMVGISGHKMAEAIFTWGIALLLLANIIVAGKQMVDPGYTLLLPRGIDSQMVTGLYSHYNEAANYFIASSVLVLAAGLFSKNQLSIRILWILIGMAGLACVWYTRSRGGILGMAVALGVLAIFALILCKRANSRWFVILLIALPVIGFGLSAYLLSGWQASQETRGGGLGVGSVLDNVYRLYFLGIAISCIGLHPLVGGGSRSFSWECFQFADGNAQGSAVLKRPEFVHNELLQAATDYGMIGAALLIILLGSVLVLFVIKIVFEVRPEDRDLSKDALRIGACAALVGMLVQSSFSFVFHLFPGVMLLGICLGHMARPSLVGNQLRSVTASRSLLTLATIGCCAVLIPFGLKGTIVTQSLWAVFFSRSEIASPDSRIDKLSAAIHHWPLTEFYQQRAIAYQDLATSVEAAPLKTSRLLTARDDFQRAASLHPFYPAYFINAGNLMSELGEDEGAEINYAKAIALQGGMEPAFRAVFSSSIHYLKKGIRLLSKDELLASVNALEIASEQVETAYAEFAMLDMYQTRIAVHEGLGAAHEAAGNLNEAMDSYKLAASCPGGNRANYRLGALFGKLAAEAWKARRPSEALGFFNQASFHLSITTELPGGITSGQKLEYQAYLNQTIAFLTAAKVTPPPVKPAD